MTKKVRITVSDDDEEAVPADSQQHSSEVPVASGVPATVPVPKKKKKKTKTNTTRQRAAPKIQKAATKKRSGRARKNQTRSPAEVLDGGIISQNSIEFPLPPPLPIVDLSKDDGVRQALLQVHGDLAPLVPALMLRAPTANPRLVFNFAFGTTDELSAHIQLLRQLGIDRSCG